MGSKAEQARALRDYANSQGEAAKKLASGDGVMFYKVLQRDGVDVRVACDAADLDPDERQRQINEAVRNATNARRKSNREAKALESE